MATSVFVTFDIGDRIRCRPGRRHILKCFRRDLREHAWFDADVGDAYPAAVKASRQQQMRGLAAKEGDGLDRAHGCSHNGA
jgi:hypothetical protein